MNNQVVEPKWYKTINKVQRNALIGGMGGWMLDAMDVLLYVMSLTSIMKEFNIDTAIAGLLASVTLFSSAIGGIVFGIVADYFGRKKALAGAVAIYTVFTGLSGIATSVTELAIYRTLLGLGMGGTWASGALLVSETWPKEHRGKASGFMQGGWALGYMMAAALSGAILPVYGWRVLFFVGVVPSVLMFLFIVFYTQEPELWLTNKKTKAAAPVVQKTGDGFTFFQIFKPDLLRFTVIGAIFVSFVQLGYWGLFTWLPGFLSTPLEKGGAGLNIVKTAGWVFAMQIGALIGYNSFGFVADHYGRKRAFTIFLVIAAILVPVYGSLRDPFYLFLLGPLVGLFGSGYFSGFGAFLAELFPTRVRGTAQGFVYNFGRGVSALAPFIIGTLAKTFGIGTSLFVTSAFFIGGVITVAFLPETKGKVLDD
ncbi:major facilitator superfamily MFS_1 [Thermosinus carboxydivorans Nor1]|uniref:Major facilitator superfamily MFS_1 n=1 Tax=Thermosinus carboxydivorans Nor1 TaxID=401526 RepID=A1HRB5_9FIRM|nr:MFS transporter [Thermosinus carboxydivorans]EAX47430.1 major facilitator superfamily MFS_1 [Thermosinus carboxydivorans Nor1]